MVKINTKIEELFEDKADEAGFCLDKKWGDYPNPYVDKSTRIAFDFFRSGFLTSDVCAKEKLEGCVVVPVDSMNKTIDAIENMFEEDTTLALGELLPIQQDIKAMLEAARGVNE